MKKLIKESLKNSMTYKDYVELVAHLAEHDSTTGNQKTESLIGYTKLNDRRMRRWDKTLKIGDDIQGRIENLDKEITWLVLTESWCGDAAHMMPVMKKMADLNKNIDLKVLLRDDNEELMQNFLTEGSKAIPKLISIDSHSGEVQKTYGPRPSNATTLVKEYKAQHGQLSPEFKEDLQRWYNKDKGQTTFNDLADLLGI